MSEAEHNPLDSLRALIDLRYDQKDWMSWKERTPELTQALRAMTLDEAYQLARELLARPDRNRFDWLLGQLNATVSGSLAALADDLLDSGMLRPEWLYLGAPPSLTRRILRLLEGIDDETPLNGYLLALAWIGDEAVRDQFREWRANPPTWKSRLYIPPEDYATCEGWELMPDGDDRRLYRWSCYELLPVAASEYQPGAVAVWTDNDASCGWCGRQLVTLLDMDLRDLRCRKVFDDVRPDAERLRIAHCSWCSGYATLFTDIDLRGGSVWSAANERMPSILERVGTGKGEVIEGPTDLRLVLGAKRRTPFEATGRFMLDETGVSQLGGHPEWVQDANYPACPTCQRRMECVGQVSWEDLDAFAEGCTYAFVCLPCGKATTVYQQT